MKKANKFIFPSLSIAILCVIFSYFITGFLDFPKEIKILENSVSKMNFNLPIKAVIEPETTTVLRVNNEPVKENITIDLNEPLTIEPSSTGQASMTLNAFGVPVKKLVFDVLPNFEVVPCGSTIGVKIHTKGVMVLGTGTVEGTDGKEYEPCKGILKSGDLIMMVDGHVLNNKNDLIDFINNGGDEITIELDRKGEKIETIIKPVSGENKKEKKIGAWVRDGTQGIGTITYYNPQSNKFAALGHGILDIDTKQMMNIKEGNILESEVVEVIKGKKGVPGELIGRVRQDKIIGNVEQNSPYGIFGTIDFEGKSILPKEKMPIALQDKVHEGPATIRSNVEKNSIEEYDIYIESINRLSNDNTKGMVIRITDPELIKKTNGIVQGMSGSPIIQDGNLVGAVTHVFVQEPTKGYGIFIENMLDFEAS